MATSASAAENVVPKGTAIMFDNTSTEWTDVYIYGWAYGFSGEFLPMTQVAGTNLYYYILPEDVPVATPTPTTVTAQPVAIPKTPSATPTNGAFTIDNIVLGQAYE